MPLVDSEDWDWPILIGCALSSHPSHLYLALGFSRWLLTDLLKMICFMQTTNFPTYRSSKIKIFFFFSLQTNADMTPESPSCLGGGTCWLATPTISLTEDDTSIVQQDVCSPPPTIRPKVIVVHPATHCGKLQQEGFNRADW